MGSWGPALYSNDTAQDVRDSFKGYLQKGKTKEEATKMILDEFGFLADEPEEAASFWCALADTQWKLGMLDEEVKKHAITCIDNGADLDVWEEDNPQGAKKRKAMFAELKEKLLSPMPPEKKIRVRKPYICPWRIGDTFALEVENKQLKEKGLKWIILRKIDNKIDYEGNTVPVVYIKMSKREMPPESEDDYNSVDYILTSKPNIYRKIVYTSSTRQIPKRIIFIGNFSHVKPPMNEGLVKDIIPSSFWKFLENDTAYVTRFIDFKEEK